MTDWNVACNLSASSRVGFQHTLSRRHDPSGSSRVLGRPNLEIPPQIDQDVGAATSAGVESQNRVAARLAVRILTESGAQPLLDWPGTIVAENPAL